MISKLLNPFIAVIFLLSLAMPAQAVRYLGDPKDAVPIENFLASLRTQYKALEKLMNMTGELDTWHKKLEQENARLSAESERAKADKKRLAAGEISQEELNRKWLESGRSLTHDRELKAFQEEIAKFNQKVRAYNDLTKKLSTILEKRTPSDITRLMGEMRKLETTLRTALDEGNIEKAKFIVKRSPIASEFGYQSN